jgi:hypothetical protein
MLVPNAYLQFADRLSATARDVVKHLLQQRETAAMLEQIATHLREIDDEALLLTEAQAVRFSRGYSADYLRRAVRNHGTSREPLYRKADLPRKPVAG